jgi:hypothetical protein
MALAAASKSSKVRLRGAGVWERIPLVSGSILRIAPQSGQVTSNGLTGLAFIAANILKHLFVADGNAATRTKEAVEDSDRAGQAGMHFMRGKRDRPPGRRFSCRKKMSEKRDKAYSPGYRLIRAIPAQRPSIKNGACRGCGKVANRSRSTHQG